MAKARRVEAARWVQERIKVDNTRRAAAAAATKKEVGEKAVRRTEVDMVAWEQGKRPRSQRGHSWRSGKGRGGGERRSQAVIPPPLPWKRRMTT